MSLGFDENIIKITAGVVCLGIGYLGLRHKILNFSGVLSGIIIGLGILLILPVVWFIPFMALFFIGGLTAKYKYPEKEIMGVAEQKEGRSVKNVLANCGVAFLCVVLYAVHPNPVFLAGYLCAIATATSDTSAVEIGQLSSKKPILITTLKPVKTGTDGAISLLGESAALIVAMFVSAIPMIFGIENGFDYFIIGTVAGFLGCHVDSIIGATLQLKGIVDNHGTNLIATLSGAVIGMVLWAFILI